MIDLHKSKINTEPFLRWAGSKRKILPQLEGYWKRDYRRYIEPFAGCAALFFRLNPPRAVLSDLNSQLIEVYEIVKANPDEFHKQLSILPSGEAHYYKMRNQNPDMMSKFRRAIRFVYLNRHCFNGIYRTNEQGKFNVPFGGQKPGVIPRIEIFRKCSLLLQQATIRACDFGLVLSNTREGDFVYIDPPFKVSSRRVFRQYGPREFSADDLQRLGKHLDQMNKRGVDFVVSYADCSEARRLLNGWNVHRVPVRRNIAGFVGARKMAYELIATNIVKKGRNHG